MNQTHHALNVSVTAPLHDRIVALQEQVAKYTEKSTISPLKIKKAEILRKLLVKGLEQAEANVQEIAEMRI